MRTDLFRALVLREQNKQTHATVEQLTHADLPEGDVLLAVDYSSINYKDAMAVTGTGKIIRKFPMVPGIDLAGTVLESHNPHFTPGAQVLLTGWGVGERYWGGYSQVQRVRSEWLLPQPAGISQEQSMVIGTAGLTAMLCVLALEDAGITPQSGKIVVSGANGGVGSVAIALLARLGYQVIALTRTVTPAAQEYLTGLGATEVIGGEEWKLEPKALETQKWAGAIDTVGGTVLARLLAEMDYQGAVAACGLAGGVQLATTVMPFILRGVKLLGIDSVQCPNARRIQAWERLARDLDFSVLAAAQRSVGLEGVAAIAAEMMAGKSHGRVVVKLHD